MNEVPRLHGFEILETLGSGAMGIVYKARMEGRKGLVALKVIAPRFSRDPVFRERLSKEARAASLLKHENIVQGIDVGEAEGLHYFAMEFVEGTNLGRRIQESGPLSEEDALGIASQMAKALRAAHRAGILHRDIKPSNILLTASGQAKLADLGLVKEIRRDAEPETDARPLAALEGLDPGASLSMLISEGNTLTRSGTALGTPYYMPPEQIRGEKSIDARADIYALGATLYHAVAGHPPYGGRTVREVLDKALAGTWLPPREAGVDVSEGFDALVRTMMAPDRNARYATPAELIEAIEAVRAGGLPSARAEPADAAPAAASPRARPSRAPGRKRPIPPETGKRPASRILPIGIAAAGVLLVAAAIALWPRTPPPEAPRIAEAERNSPPPTVAPPAAPLAPVAPPALPAPTPAPPDVATTPPKPADPAAIPPDEEEEPPEEPEEQEPAPAPPEPPPIAWAPPPTPTPPPAIVARPEKPATEARAEFQRAWFQEIAPLLAARDGNAALDRLRALRASPDLRAIEPEIALEIADVERAAPYARRLAERLSSFKDVTTRFRGRAGSRILRVRDGRIELDGISASVPIPSLSALHLEEAVLSARTQGLAPADARTRGLFLLYGGHAEEASRLLGAAEPRDAWKLEGARAQQALAAAERATAATRWAEVRAGLETLRKTPDAPWLGPLAARIEALEAALAKNEETAEAEPAPPEAPDPAKTAPETPAPPPEPPAVAPLPPAAPPPAGGLDPSSLVRDLQSHTGRTLAIERIERGKSFYTDRTAYVAPKGPKDEGKTDSKVLSYPPFLEGAAWIRTPSSDRDERKDRILSFTLARPSRIVVGLDPKLSPAGWMRGWERMDGRLTFRWYRSDAVANLFRSPRLPAGPVTLGANPGDGRNYTVFVLPEGDAGADSAPPPPPAKAQASPDKAGPPGALVRGIAARSGKRYEMGTAKIDGTAFTDRDYVFQKLPEPLQGLALLKTACDDKDREEADLLTFELASPARVFVAYDRRAEQIPAWLRAFRRTEMETVISKWTNPLAIYEKDFPPGPIVLGGNLSQGAKGTRSPYVVFFRPAP